MVVNDSALTERLNTAKRIFEQFLVTQMLLIWPRHKEIYDRQLLSKKGSSDCV